MQLATGDDGVHADYVLTLGTEGGADDDYTIDISTSYEGVEGSVINILSGTTYLYATDDGINAAGDYTEDGTLASLTAMGGDMSGSQGGNTSGGSGSTGPDQGTDDTSPYGMLYIKGGMIYVEAEGDGLDSNGSADVSGGVVIINGPTSGDNGVFDIGDTSDCYFNITGGTLIGAGTSDMEVSINVSGQGYIDSSSSSSSSGSMGNMGGMNPGGTSGSTSSGSAGSPVKVTTDSGNIVFIPKVSWSYMFITTPDMSSNGSYTIESISSYSGGTQVLGKTVNNVYYGLIENAD